MAAGAGQRIILSSAGFVCLKMVKKISANFRASHWVIVLFLIAAFILFYRLGTPALFEPDEGRNAEKAREILLTGDWVTPHQDFLPVLDKPIFFYWLVALSYNFFGISEATARLPSALAALGCVIAIYCLVKKAFGFWEALWGGLVLVTSVEFFLLARIVIFDMTLTLFMTLALCCFYWGLHADHAGKRRLLYGLMYAAMAAATLVKGLVGVALPGMIIGGFLVLTKKLSELKKLQVISGTIVFLLIVAPWYVSVELRNPGYLRYFFWEEHFIRFLTPHFHRSEPWYYFLLVLTVGFLPWTFLLPHVVLTRRARPLDEATLFLALWAILPLLVFSFSNSKLPHYILPLYPALAALTGITVAKTLSDHSAKRHGVLFLPFAVEALVLLLLAAGAIWPSLLPQDLGRYFAEMASLLLVAGGLAVLGLVAIVFGWRGDYLRRLDYAYGYYGVILVPLFIVIVHVIMPISEARSAKPLAQKFSAAIPHTDQLAFYGKGGPEGLPFYLNTQRPIWIGLRANKPSDIIGSFYLAEHPSQPSKRYGKILFTFDEFIKEWQSPRPLSVITTDRRLPELAGPGQKSPWELSRFEEYVLVRNQ